MRNDISRQGTNQSIRKTTENSDISKMEHHPTTVAADLTVRSQDSNNSSDSKDTKVSKISENTQASKDSKPESCHESKHSKEMLINSRHYQARHYHQDLQQQSQQRNKEEPKDDSNVLILTSCGQLLLGIVLVVFGVLALVHGASLGGSGAGLWSGVGALVAGALGVITTLATTSSNRAKSGFSSAHLASSLVALALSNMAAIIELTAVSRDLQRTPSEVMLLNLPVNEATNVEEDWAGLLASISLLVASVAELLVSGYTCTILVPKLCSCLQPTNDDNEATLVDSKVLRNMVHQWIIAQNHIPKNQPIYVVQPLVPVHSIIQTPYGMHPPSGKFTGDFLATSGAATAYGVLPILSAHMAYPIRPPSQIIRGKQQQQQQKKRRHSSDPSDNGGEPHQHHSSAKYQQQHSNLSDDRYSSVKKPKASIDEDQLQDLAHTYTGLDKRISEEFISIAMDPERKSKASSYHSKEISTIFK